MQLDFFQPKQRPSFHNSVPIHGKELIQAERNADIQDEYVLTVFEETGKDFNAWEMYQEIQARGRTMLEKSVRRALTNLTTDEKLERTNVMRPGQWGAGNSVYRLCK
ncbi:MAG: hypothetical protein ACK50Z_04325 [Betaproteobacteria bacterium]|jgi:hypothetical protein